MPIYHGKNLRKGRWSESGRAYLVTTVVSQREPLFTDFFLARLLVRELRACTDRGMVETMAWVVMPDHLHWLLVPKNASLAQAVQRAKSCAARAVNSARGRRGRVWQPGFHERALRRDEDLPAAARYLVANPLRAGIVKHLCDYPHWDAIWL